MIRVLFFGPVAERVGARRIDLPYQAGMTWRDVRDALEPRYREAFALVSIVAVDGERVGGAENPPLADGAEIVFMSQFSGG
jgi:molybdopterin converting factor small subunit